ncbi:sorbitol-6-phosphate dehydrogenase [bacterium]|nr:sorbitol-6-phosphate dehydrogenase [bacterium]
MATPDTYPQPNPAPRLSGKYAIVTGSAQGLGEAIAACLASHGCNLMLTDVNAVGVEEVARLLTDKYGVQAFGLGCDITDEAQVLGAFDKLRERFGRLDLLVSNAGILTSGPITEFEVAKWRKVIDVNLVGYMVMAKHAAKMMIAQKSGAIIQINSKSGKTGSSKNSAYAASKFGGIGLTQSLALELAEHGIRVNSICPGNLLDSPLWQDSLYEQYAKRWNKTVEEVRSMYVDKVPMKRGCAYADVCAVLLYLAGDESSYVTGQALNVDGGQTMH